MGGGAWLRRLAGGKASLNSENNSSVRFWGFLLEFSKLDKDLG